MAKMTAPAGRASATSTSATAGVRGTPRSQRSSHASRAVRGRESLLVRKVALLKDENHALRAERVEDGRRMAKVIPFVRFARLRCDDVAAEHALGVVQLEVERIGRRAA
jgi:hypothetical protein